MYFSSISTPIGELRLLGSYAGLEKICFDGTEAGKVEGFGERNDELFADCIVALERYFRGELREFDIDLRYGEDCSSFDVSVWEELRRIPYGETRTYGEVAKAIGRPMAARAVGMANHRNCLPIVVPCHRVIGSNGSLVGYAGGLDVKAKLIELERLNRDG